MRRKTGFTFIEMAIAVALVAILVVIALPRHHEALVRSRVSRAKADLRQLSVAMEAYAIDNAANYPFDLDPRGWPWYITDILTTPVSYLPGNSIPIDPFRTEDPYPPRRRYRLINYPANLDPGWPPCPLPPPPDGPYHTRWFTVGDPLVEQGMATFGKWKISSSGPDKLTNSDFFTSGPLYDPSNGTVSRGDIFRSQFVAPSNSISLRQRIPV